MPSVLPIEMNFDTTHGSGIIWFIVLYFVSAYIRLYESEEQKMNLKGYKYLILYFVFISFIAISRIILWKNYQLGVMYNYNFILVFLASVSLFLFFRKVKINKSKWTNRISYIASLTFGGYVIHEQEVFRTKVLYNKILHTDLWKNSLKGFLISVLLVLGSFVIYLLIEACRQKIWKFIKSKVFRKNV